VEPSSPVQGSDGGGALSGLPSDALRRTEKVLHHWGAPGGRGILTTERCLLLSHPRPLHREIEWERDLEKVQSLEVVALRDDPEVVAFVSQSLAGSVKTGDPTAGVINSEFKVAVDGISVYQGSAQKGEEIQAWIDDARSSRCLSLYGRLIPYGTPSPP